MWSTHATRKLQGRGSRLLFENRTVLAHPLSTFSRLSDRFLATQDDTLEEEDMILPVYVGFRHDKEVVEEKLAEVLEMVTLPIVDSGMQTLHCLLILGAPLCLVDLISNALGGIRSLLQFVVVGICRW